MKNKNLLIFDFDGVLADSLSCLFSLVRDAMDSIGISLNEEEYRMLFIGNVHQGFKDFIKNEDKYSAFLDFRLKNFNKYYRPLLFPKVASTLKSLSKDYVLAIASSGKQDALLKMLKKNKISDLFNLVIANKEYSKQEMLERILNTFGSKPSQTYMITDTVGDIKIAKKVGLKTIAVTWGFHSKNLLKKSRPTYIADKLIDLRLLLGY